MVDVIDRCVHPLALTLARSGHARSLGTSRCVQPPLPPVDQRCDRTRHLRRHRQQCEASYHPASAGQASAALTSTDSILDTNDKLYPYLTLGVAELTKCGHHVEI